MHIYPTQYPTEHTAGDRTPYTYHICWSWLDMHYYGARYGLNVHPSDLWNPYKTSSEYVAAFIEEHGDPDIIEIRKIFDSVNNTKIWEGNVLKRLNAANNNKWLNKSNMDGKFLGNSEGKASYKDENGNIIYCSTDDPRIINGELIHIHKGKTTLKDKDGNLLRCSAGEKVEGFFGMKSGKSTFKDKNGEKIYCNTDDPRVLSGELVGLNSGIEFPEEAKEKMRGRATYKDQNGNSVYCNTDDPRVLSGELVGRNHNKANFKDVYGNIFQCDVDDPRVLSGELVGLNSGIIFSDETLEKMRESALSRPPMSQETKNKIGNSLRGVYVGEKNHAFGKHLTPEHKILVGLGTKGTTWYNNGIINKRLKIDPGEGWVKGRIKKENLTDSQD